MDKRSDPTFLHLDDNQIVSTCKMFVKGDFTPKRYIFFTFCELSFLPKNQYFNSKWHVFYTRRKGIMIFLEFLKKEDISYFLLPKSKSIFSPMIFMERKLSEDMGSDNMLFWLS